MSVCLPLTHISTHAHSPPYALIHDAFNELPTFAPPLPPSLSFPAEVLPINLYGDYVDGQAASGSSNTGSTMYYTIANIPPGSDLYW